MGKSSYQIAKEIRMPDHKNISGLVDAPPHYTYGSKECIEFIDDVGATQGYLLGNAIKYIFRHEHKGDAIGDIQKAIKCLQMYIEGLPF